MARDSGHDDFPGGNENFLVGKRNVFAVLDRFVSGGQSDNADSRGDNGAGVRMGGDPLDSLGTEKDFDWFGVPLAVNGSTEFPGRALGAYRNQFGMMTRDLFGD